MEISNVGDDWEGELRAWHPGGLISKKRAAAEGGKMKKVSSYPFPQERTNGAAKKNKKFVAGQEQEEKQHRERSLLTQGQGEFRGWPDRESSKTTQERPLSTLERGRGRATGKKVGVKGWFKPRTGCRILSGVWRR